VESAGINKIPAVMAEVLKERIGVPVAGNIVQANRAGHTGASGYERLAFPPLFEGDVSRGREHILVDDFVGQGGTLANLKGFIETAGGRVAGATTLTGKSYSARLNLRSETLMKLRDKHGSELENWWKRQYGYGFDVLTESEARYLERADDADAIRNRIAQARSGADARRGRGR
jgi:hypoxanthine-guanine phosphoribosyltransferase